MCLICTGGAFQYSMELLQIVLGLIHTDSTYYAKPLKMDSGLMMPRLSPRLTYWGSLLVVCRLHLLWP